MQITTHGVIIRERTMDDDRVLTILTKGYGVITAYARGAKKLRGRLLSSTELLCYSRFVLFKNKDRYSVDQAESDTNFFGIRQDIEKLSLASYFAQLCIQLAPAEEPAEEYLRLMLNSLYLLEKDQRPQLLVKAAFELRMLTMAGYMPNLVGCRECGEFEISPMRFLPRSGELVCPNCLIGSSDGMAVPLESGVLASMRHILYSDFDKLFHFTLSEEGLKKLSAVTQTYLLNQLEMPFATLDFYNSLFPA